MRGYRRWVSRIRCGAMQRDKCNCAVCRWFTRCRRPGQQQDRHSCSGWLLHDFFRSVECRRVVLSSCCGWRHQARSTRELACHIPFRHLLPQSLRLPDRELDTHSWPVQRWSSSILLSGSSLSPSFRVQRWGLGKKLCRSPPCAVRVPLGHTPRLTATRGVCGANVRV